MLAEGVLLSGLSLSSTSTYPPLKQETFVGSKKRGGLWRRSQQLSLLRRTNQTDVDVCR